MTNERVGRFSGDGVEVQSAVLKWKESNFSDGDREKSFATINRDRIEMMVVITKKDVGEANGQT